ncbi:beta-D-glucosyl crocetin beta-1,6-glucosyltransferase-like [Impatiens glandulifera]|uniref:beta-D-glucosyl crocetin beta-1,6-glucosyltransferase-like n=1 Tax=Impatiens glandulifera TaxID=253017 RepID=UPI001FB13020|nr:beta-D-glucosyl crocetin beta-1,6-glucosyltransferase-like [Impatiens glandulifera]
MEMETKKPRLNVLMFPWLAYGHISPYLELAKRLADRNFQIYLCSTPINLSSISKRVTEKHTQSIKLIEFHLPSQPDLPPNFHTTNGLPLHLNSVLKRAMDMACPSFTQIITTLKPDILIYDYHQPWASVAASSLGIPAVQFFPVCASIICYLRHKILKQDVHFPYPAMNPRGTYWNQKFQEMMKGFTNTQGGQSTASHSSLTKTCDIIFVKTFGDMEGKYIEYGSKLLGKRIVPTGPLLQEQADDDDDDNDDDDSWIMEWLNNKDTSSTILVSIGSESFLSKMETEEIAKGLELSMMNFIWVVRFPSEEKISIDEALPNGFLKRVGDRGLVIEKWAPQARILGHPNVGGFVSHCGWGSIIEAMSFGIPIVAIPMNYEQPVTARLVEEIGVSLEVNRDDNGGLNGVEIADLIRELVVGEKGKQMRDKAREMRENIKSKGEEEIDGVVEELYKLHKKNIEFSKLN